MIHPALMNALAGRKFKIVTGYRGAGDTYLALERGELAATTVAWDGLVAERGAWLSEGKVKVLVRIGRRKIAGFEHVPSLTDLGNTAEDKAVLELVARADGSRASGGGAARSCRPIASRRCSVPST